MLVCAEGSDGGGSSGGSPHCHGPSQLAELLGHAPEDAAPLPQPLLAASRLTGWAAGEAVDESAASLRQRSRSCGGNAAAARATARHPAGVHTHSLAGAVGSSDAGGRRVRPSLLVLHQGTSGAAPAHDLVPAVQRHDLQPPPQHHDSGNTAYAPQLVAPLPQAHSRSIGRASAPASCYALELRHGHSVPEAVHIEAARSPPEWQRRPTWASEWAARHTLKALAAATGSCGGSAQSLLDDTAEYLLQAERRYIQ